ncbi:MAG: hypothetical protein ACRECR_00775, partial [Thermoplasmata archaeon]
MSTNPTAASATPTPSTEPFFAGRARVLAIPLLIAVALLMILPAGALLAGTGTSSPQLPAPQAVGGTAHALLGPAAPSLAEELRTGQ